LELLELLVLKLFCRTARLHQSIFITPVLLLALAWLIPLGRVVIELLGARLGVKHSFHVAFKLCVLISALFITKVQVSLIILQVIESLFVHDVDNMFA